jgi:hypothetical protein
MQKYYFITVFQSYDERGPHGMRCWGFYNNFQAAEDTLVNNVTDLWETCYDYGVIEEYEEGISNYQFERWFYKYDQETDKYLPIDDINELRHYAGFAVG